ncbi:phosphatidylglycerophosphatase A [Helicobacter pullorum]|uniref:Phosphatidylglycerophosphatase n=1 Tax=Helicobacter pullorum TaxID=35818 RepID=A0A0N0LUF9_9HELI|nr:phosphatidylglycerophosphatase A [Helicobacter pullorum]KPH54444.1 phosphatidylglycerophosphatase [Helicobacter pullorum]KPH56349.1 phosphatidylglycerophosphatase [Helicobacter pullorum]OCR09046.1 phosphatidylglycerophosphatase A [Helicobacter pullorum]OCR17721.1 phosphatidylglycerophosphatase A [Helicobacter pullorum]STQ87859.1 phosphatidylglycerophosphatase A [Helicobacter pullorum]
MKNKNFFLDFKGTKDFIQKMYLTLFFSGLSPKAPGTIGTIVALPFGWAISYYIAPSTLLLLALLLGAIGIKIIDNYEKQGLSHDRKEIVIDELAGVWISIAMIGHSLFALFLSFILFRIFDIWKPSIIHRVDKNVKGGLGVIGDDLLAGFFAGILGLIILKALYYFPSLYSFLNI